MSPAQRGAAPSAWTNAELEAILDALPVPIGWWSPELQLRYGNAAVIGRFDEPRSEIVGHHMRDLLGDDWVTDNAESFAAALRGETAYVTREYLEPDGERRRSSLTLVPMRPLSGLDGFVVVAFDVTSRVRAREESLDNTRRTDVLVERRHVAVRVVESVVDKTLGCVAQLNRVEDGEDVDWPAVRDTVSRRLDEVIAELRATIRSLHEPFALPPLEHGTQAKTYPMHGVTDAPATGEAPMMTTHELLAILDAVPAMVTGWDIGFYNTFANESALRGYGFGSREEIRRKHGSQLLGQLAFEASIPFAEAARAGHAQRFARRVPDPDNEGRLRTSEVAYAPQTVGGVTVGVVAIVQDVTAEADAQEALLQSARELSIIAERTRIAEDLHDLVIQHLFAAALQINGPQGGQPGTVQQAVESMHDALFELQRALLGLHDIAGNDLGANGVAPQEPWLDTGPLLDKAAGRAARTLGFDPVVSRSGMQTHIPPATAADLLAVLNEAISNAARHAAAHHLEVALHVDVESLSIRIEDDGRGIGAPTRLSGLANLRARAERRHGTFSVTPRSPRGTVLEWWVPLPVGV